VQQSRPAAHRDKTRDQQFAKVVTRVVGPGIGDVVEGGKENVHEGSAFRKEQFPPKNPFPENRKTPRIRFDPKRDSPDAAGGV
jgi:hypothetical protein